MESRVVPGVTFTIAKMSFARRVELMRRVRELARRMEFPGGERRRGRQDGCGAATAEIERVYVTWGVKAVAGLAVDGQPPRVRNCWRRRARGILPRGAGSGAERDRAERRRKKKLLVAFHFQFSNQAGWECDACRRSGLEIRRRCGWLGLPHDGRAAPVWARKTVAIESCPKSYITAESEGLVEEFLVRRRLGGMNFGELSARQVESIPDSGAGAGGGDLAREQQNRPEIAQRF